MNEILQPKLGSYTTPPSNQQQPWYIWRPKGYIGPRGLTLISLLMIFSLLMILARILAMPSMPLVEWPLFDTLGQFGVMLNNTLTLTWVPVSDRNTVIYLLLLPTAGLIISIVRLTFGLRILGYRSVLMAVGFYEIGILPSLLVIALVVGIIILMRPAMKRARLSLYARISMILGITSCILISTLFIGSWLRSEWIWSLAFFPVVILAMMAESVAATLDQESPKSAAWRLGWTIAIALVLVLLMRNPVVLDVLIRFPELMLLQVLSIVLVSEYFDFRMFQGWQNSNFFTTVSNLLQIAPNMMPRKSRVAVIRNRSSHGTIGRLGPVAPAKGQLASMQHLVDALRDEGYNVKVVEGDRTLLRELRKFLIPHPRSGIPGGVALNFSSGIQGYGRHIHVPAMLEMVGVAYTGPDPIGLARLQDRFTMFSLLQQAGVSVPPFRLLHDPNSIPADLVFPALVLPRSDPDASILIKTTNGLAKAIKQINVIYGQEILLQSRIPGPEFRVAILGNTHLESLPLLRIDASGQQRECPAPIENALADRIRDCAYLAYRIAGCRDYARVDLRLNADGEPCVVGIHVQGIFARKGSIAIMAKAASLDWSNLLRHIIELAAERTGAELATKFQNNSVMQKPTPVIDPTVVDNVDIASHTAKAH